MSTITVATGEIDNYQGEESAPLIRIFVSKNFVASDGDAIPRSTPESGEFYKELVCAVAAGVITYPEFTIDSTTDAVSNPKDAKYRFDLFTSAGVFVANLFSGLRVPATPTPTTLGALASYNEDNVPAAAVGAYTTSQTDVLLAGKIDGSGIDKITVGTSEPLSPSVGDLWIDTDN